VLWDSLTHSHGWFISLFPSMRQPLGVVGGILFKRYDIIAVASAVVGVVILATAYARWYRRAPVLHTFRPHPLPWTARFAIGTGIGGSSALAGLGYAFITTPTETVKPFVASTLVSSVSAFLAIWALYSAVWHILTSPGQRGHSPQHAGAMPDNRAPSPGRKP